MEATDLAYFAGIVDGEGHVCVRRGNLAIVLCMADVQILQWCHATFGGSLSNNWKNEHMARPRKMWSLRRAHGLEDVARAMLPYLVLKRREVEIMLDAIEHSRRPVRTGPRRAAWLAAIRVIEADAHSAMLARR